MDDRKDLHASTLSGFSHGGIGCLQDLFLEARSVRVSCKDRASEPGWFRRLLQPLGDQNARG